jgi:6-phosphogluconolactonase/glucosamine-6-phosphate isomerase/deaminase
MTAPDVRVFADLSALSAAAAEALVATVNHGGHAVAVTAPAKPPRRLTLTPPALIHAAAVYFLVAGSSKAHAAAAGEYRSAGPASGTIGSEEG